MSAFKRQTQRVRPGSVRWAALVLCAVLLVMPLLLRQNVQAAGWMEPYLQQVTDWGVMRGDSSGELHPDRAITRAEFVTLVNRAFGYTEVGPNPFSDVQDSDWYAEDIRIARQAGYFNGTSDNTASPRSLVTREQAAALLARCLRLQGTTGSTTDFDDGLQIGTQFRGLVQESANLGIIQGYADGTFRPKALITRGQMACFLVRALGTLVQEPGEQIESGVYGNLTINTSGVKLKDTTITGNLYLTGGVGLGNVELENVNVMGKIVICGGGLSEKGDNSVVLRNVVADSLEVDSLADQFLSVRVEGLTNIDNTTIRTSAYVEDVTGNNLGLRFITLDGKENTRLQLAGNIKEIVNISPNSALEVVQGVAHTVTMDERAVNSTLSIAQNSSINKLNLDAATPVTGQGSIADLTVNADGASSTMLPDKVTVRPGITANINGENMNNVAAEESSEEPRLLSGYPVARNVAPTTADVVFSTNKRGTIRWALTTLTDGSVGENELMNPTGYSGKIVQSGTIAATASNTEFTTRLTNLTRDGSYYISALLEDNRGHRSPVKVASFTTPDDTVPAFSAGYPTAILTVDSEDDTAQVIQSMVMANKDCKLYYALLPNNAAAPTPADFRSSAITGNLGYGIVDIKKNTPFLIPRVNTSYLEEETTYNLYLWLNDADNNRSSNVVRLNVTTLDKTPPTIIHITDITDGNGLTATSASFTFALDEPGTLYWAVVKEGTEFYRPIADGTPNGRIPDPSELVAKIQVERGTGALVRGSANANTAGADVTFTVTGLEGQTRYKLYYVAKDRAGNYNVYTEALTPPHLFSTLDNEGPTVNQTYNKDQIQLEFSEAVEGMWIDPVTQQASFRNFRNLYLAVLAASNDPDAQAKAKNALAEALKAHITLYNKGTGEPVTDRALDTSTYEWIDYREATVTPDASGNGKMYITFPEKKAVSRVSGETYYFVLKNIVDASQNHNPMEGIDGSGSLQLPDITTEDAKVNLKRATTLSGYVDNKQVNFDMAFTMEPEGVDNVSADQKWDLLFWYTYSDPAASSVEFELYHSDNGGASWVQDGVPGHTTARIQTFPDNRETGISMAKYFYPNADGSFTFEQLREMIDRQYAIRITRIGTSGVREDWSTAITFRLQVVASDQGALQELVRPDLTPASWEANQNGDNAVRDIGTPKPFTVTHTFSDSAAPKFVGGYPNFSYGDESVDITIMLNRSNTTCYYVVAPLGTIPTTYKPSENANPVSITNSDNWQILDEDGGNFNDTGDRGLVTAPGSVDIMNPNFRNDEIKTGNIRFTSGALPIPTITGLRSNQEYIAYFVLRGESQSSYSGVYAFRFKTEPVVRPVLQVDLGAPNGTISEVNRKEASGGWMIIPDTMVPEALNQTVDSVSNRNTSELNPAHADLWQSSYGNLTLLEAMQTSVRRNNTVVGTVFDLFVLKSVQDTIGDSIVRGSYGVGQNGTLTLNSNNNFSFVQNYTQWMSPGVNYYLVAVAKSPQGSAYAGAANYPLYTRDTQHPKITSVLTTTGQWYSTPQEAMTARYTGSFTVQFDETLYWKDSQASTDLLKLAYTNRVTGATKPNEPNVVGYQAATALLQQGNVTLDATRYDSPVNGQYPSCSSLFFNFESPGLTINSSIGLNTRSLSDAAGNAGFGDGNISLQLELVTTVVGGQRLYGAQFVVVNASSGWLAENYSYSYPRGT